MAFCKFCGAQLPENSTFCPECGKQLGAPQQSTPQQNMYQQNAPQQNMGYGQQFGANTTFQPAPKKNLKLPVAIAAVVIVVVGLFFLLKNTGVVGGGTYETPIKYMCEAVSECSIKKLYKAFPPAFEELVSPMLSLMGGEEALFEELGNYAGINLSYDIVSAEPLSKEELEEYSEDLSSTYMKEMTVKEGYMVTVTLYMGGDSEEAELPVGKVDGRWCIVEGFF